MRKWTESCLWSRTFAKPHICWAVFSSACSLFMSQPSNTWALEQSDVLFLIVLQLNLCFVGLESPRLGPMLTKSSLPTLLSLTNPSENPTQQIFQSFAAHLIKRSSVMTLNVPLDMSNITNLTPVKTVGFSWSRDEICKACLHPWPYRWSLHNNIMSPTIFLRCFFSLPCLKTFSLGLGGARQFPGIVRNLTVQGFEAHVFV